MNRKTFMFYFISFGVLVAITFLVVGILIGRFTDIRLDPSIIAVCIGSAGMSSVVWTASLDYYNNKESSVSDGE